MRPIQLILIGVALIFAIGAGYVAMNLSAPEPQRAARKAPKPKPVKKVLVASKRIPMGTALSDENIVWRSWPKEGLDETFMVKNKEKDHHKEAMGAIARSTIFPGEPIREAKLVRAESGYMSAILPAGMRAVAIKVDALRAAGGFILPNDHVDIIMTYRTDTGRWITETLMQNVRVLAVDQVIEEKEGQKAKVAQTATIEVAPEQAEVITVASRIAGNKLTLALRSVADNEESGSRDAAHLLSGQGRGRTGTIRVIRSGKIKEVRPESLGGGAGPTTAAPTGNPLP